MDRRKRKLLILIATIIIVLIYTLVIPTPEPDEDVPPAPSGELDDDAPSPLGNQTIGTFDTAKRKVLEDIFHDHQRTLYCDCTYAEKVVDLEACRYQIRKSETRARRIEVEHVVPAYAFGRSFHAWREGHPDCVKRDGTDFKGRSCARRTARLFRLMEADLYNLQPAIGEVNGDRSHYPPAIIEGEARAYGACDVEIEDQRMEPRSAIRGDIARTYLYMDYAYPGRKIMTDAQRQLFLAWSEADPPDAWERKRAERIRELQGNTHPFLTP